MSRALPRRPCMDREGDDPGQRREHDQDPLGVLRPEAGREPERERQRADDGTGGIGDVDGRDEPSGVATAAGRRGERQREASAPEQRRGEDGPHTPHQIELEADPRTLRERRRDRPVGQRPVDHVGGPGHRRSQQQLGDAQVPDGVPTRSRQGRPERAADAQTEEEDGEDDRERVDGRPEQQREEARPHHLRA